MSVKKFRKNSTAAGKKKIIAGNIATLAAANKNKPKSARVPFKQILAAAFHIADPTKK